EAAFAGYEGREADEPRRADSRAGPTGVRVSPDVPSVGRGYAPGRWSGTRCVARGRGRGSRGRAATCGLWPALRSEHTATTTGLEPPPTPGESDGRRPPGLRQPASAASEETTGIDEQRKTSRPGGAQRGDVAHVPRLAPDARRALGQPGPDLVDRRRAAA